MFFLLVIAANLFTMILYLFRFVVLAVRKTLLALIPTWLFILLVSISWILYRRNAIVPKIARFFDRIGLRKLSDPLRILCAQSTSLPSTSLRLNVVVPILCATFLMILLAAWISRESLPLHKHPPIDMCIPWAGEPSVTGASARQRNNNELKYALRSLHKYSPWINKIYILQNDEQPSPSWLLPEAEGWIKSINRCTLFANPGRDCPTKNGEAAYTVCHLVPGLSEHFIQADDDILLGAPTSQDHWFNERGQPIVRTIHSSQRIYPEHLIDHNKTIKGVKLRNDWPEFKWNEYTHRMRPMRRSWAEQFDRDHPGYMAFVQSHNQDGYLGGTPTEEQADATIPALVTLILNSMMYWEEWHALGKIEYRPFDICSFYQPFYQHFKVWSFQVAVFLLLHALCGGINTINLVDEWSIDDPELYAEEMRQLKDFFDYMYPERPWFERK